MAHVETEYMGGRRARIWTYLILMLVLVVAAVVVNLVIKQPELAREGVRTFLGLPRWAFPVIVGVLGLLIYWAGLKIETDWPEALGAFLVAGSIAAGQFLLGWSRFELGGLAVVPYVIPLAVFLVLLVFGLRKSR